MSVIVPATPIVQLYDELHQPGIGHERRLSRARDFVADPSDLATKFGDSIAALQGYRSEEAFYASRKHYEIGDVSATSTTDLALRIRDAGGLQPRPNDEPAPRVAANASAPGVLEVPADALACEYLDRELVPTRTTGRATHEGTAVRLDLLLRHATDRTPIVAEVKRTSNADPLRPHRVPASDKDPFSALIQVLACIAQLSTRAQYERLARWGSTETRGQNDYPAPADLAAYETPTFDAYVVLHNRPQGTFIPDLEAETERLATLLLAQPPVAKHVRRIACLLTTLDADTLQTQSLWAYQRPDK